MTVSSSALIGSIVFILIGIGICILTVFIYSKFGIKREKELVIHPGGNGYSYDNAEIATREYCVAFCFFIVGLVMVVWNVGFLIICFIVTH